MKLRAHGGEEAQALDVAVKMAGYFESRLASLKPEEIEKVVREVIAQTGAQGAKDMGKVMKALAPVFAGRADNKLVSELVKTSLG